MPSINVPGTIYRLEFEPDHRNEFGPCDCCGSMTTRVWGYVYANDVAQASYFVEWNPKHFGEANFDLIIGKWGDGTLPLDRNGVSLRYRNDATDGPAFMVTDATKRPLAQSPLVGSALTREQVIGTSLAARVFEVIDAVYLGDPRLSFLET